jgi:integrase
MISVRGERSESRVTAPEAPPLTVILAGPRLERREDGPVPRWRARRERGGENLCGPVPPTHPELTRLLRRHLAKLGTAPDGRLFGGVRGGELPTITYRRAWIKARQLALTEAEQASSLARRPYDLRHACLSTWLNGGVYPTQVAEWAGHGADVLLRIYAKCIAGQDELAKRRISEVLRQD